LLDCPYLALLVREDLVVAGSNSVEAGGLCLLAICPVVVRGHVIHPGIVPWCPGLAADDLDEQIAIADAKSQASAALPRFIAAAVVYGVDGPSVASTTITMTIPMKRHATPKFRRNRSVKKIFMSFTSRTT
jgi:hypothetical protein